MFHPITYGGKLLMADGGQIWVNLLGTILRGGLMIRSWRAGESHKCIFQ